MKVRILGVRYLVAALVLLFAIPVTATPAEGEGALKLVKDTTNHVLEIIKNDKQALRQDHRRMFNIVNEIILPHFDFARMSRWVLGKHWRRASDTQKERFILEFKNLLVRTYSTALLEYSEQTVAYLPMRAKPQAKKVVVRTEIQQSGGLPIPINYSMYENSGAWKVYDVTIDGISMVANYRSTFSGRIRKDGLENLIALLERRNQKVTGGK